MVNGEMLITLLIQESISFAISSDLISNRKDMLASVAGIPVRKRNVQYVQNVHKYGECAWVVEWGWKCHELLTLFESASVRKAYYSSEEEFRSEFDSGRFSSDA